MAISILWFRSLDDRSELNGNNRNLNYNNRLLGIVQESGLLNMKTNKYLYPRIYSFSNLIFAWKKARKHKTKKIYVKLFESNLLNNLLQLQKELKNQIYQPKPLKTFILRDPKTRKISKSEFRDRITHHAIVNILEPVFDKTFIYDSYANRKEKGNLFAINRLNKFIKKVSNNGSIIKNNFKDKNYIKGYCLKADIRHYFQEVDHNILLNLINKKIRDEQVMQLINKIVKNCGEREREDRHAFREFNFTIFCKYLSK